MALISSIVRAPTISDVGEIFIKRDGEPDLILEYGRLALTIETKPRGATAASPNKRWKIYRLYLIVGSQDLRLKKVREGHRPQLVVAEEGHSSMEGETVRYSAKICHTAIDVWEALGKLDELKEPLAELGLSVVQKI